MPEPTPSRFQLTRTRLFLIFFIGLALLLSITTIVGSFSTWNAEDAAPAPADIDTP